MHLSGAAGAIGIIIIFPAIIHKNCKRIHTNQEELWEDEGEMLKWGAFYSGFKPEYWWFFGTWVLAHHPWCLPCGRRHRPLYVPL